MSENQNLTQKNNPELPRVSSGGIFSFDEFDRFFDDFLFHKWPHLLDWRSPVGFDKGVPKVDIIEHDNEIECLAALPGIDKNNLEVSVSGQSITIHASAKEEKKEEGNYYRREILRGEILRTVSLPDNVDTEQASATFKDGILKVKLPKTEKSKRKQIDIN